MEVERSKSVSEDSKNSLNSSPEQKQWKPDLIKELRELGSRSLGDGVANHIMTRVHLLNTLKFFALNLGSFKPTMSISDYIAKYIADSHSLQDMNVSLGGVIINVRKSSDSENIAFDLFDKSAEVLVMVDSTRNSHMDKTAFSRFLSSLRTGVTVGISAFPGLSASGELIVFAKSYTVLSYMPKLHPLPDVSTSYAQQIWEREKVSYIKRDTAIRSILETHDKIIDYIRDFLHNHKVKTTTELFCTRCYLCPSPGAWHRYLLGSSENLYEIGKKFRYEGIDLTHIPEFSKFWFHINVDLSELMDLTEQILSGIVKEITGGYKIKSYANGVDKDPVEIDFSPPFRRINMIEELNVPKDGSGHIVDKHSLNACTKYKLRDRSSVETGVNPTFIIDYHISPLKPGWTGHFELLVNKYEVFDGYAAFREVPVEQLKDCLSSDDKLTIIDTTFETTSKHWLPPTGVWGLGINRLTMLLTGSQNIEEDQRCDQ